MASSSSTEPFLEIYPTSESLAQLSHDTREMLHSTSPSLNIYTVLTVSGRHRLLVGDRRLRADSHVLVLRAQQLRVTCSVAEASRATRVGGRRARDDRPRRHAAPLKRLLLLDKRDELRDERRDGPDVLERRDVKDRLELLKTAKMRQQDALRGGKPKWPREGGALPPKLHQILPHNRLNLL
jgi:hypothetical protein